MMWKQMRRNSIRIEGEHTSSVDLCTSRLSILGLFFVLAFVVIGMRVIDLGVIQGDLMRVDPLTKDERAIMETAAVQSQKIRRGNIYDRNGVLMATNIKAASLFADPSLILEPEKVTRDLVKLFPDLNKDRTLKNLQGKGRFVWIKRNIIPAQQQKVLALGQPGLDFQYEDRRIYPLDSAAAHLLGYTDLDGNGLAGIERQYDKDLAAGKDIHLSLDVRLQHVLKREAQKAIDDFQGLAGAGVIMDAHSGEVLAGISLPDYDLNMASVLAEKPEENKEKLFNRLTLGVYELGSMFKIFSTAAFFETHENGLSQAFDVRKPIRIGRFSIDDYKGKKRILSVPEVFIYSSNIGTASMGRLVGGDYLHGFYKDLGLLDPMTFDVGEIGKPRSPAMPWKDVSIMTVSYGHGVSTTPLQMASAVSTVINGGFKVLPELLSDKSRGEDGSLLRVVSPETSEKMRKLLRLVVTQGTGSKADIKGFEVGGKTGTAEKSEGGRYQQGKLISSFVSAFPMDDPKYVVMVMVDEPKGNKDSHGYATAGWVAAPAVGRIITSMASILGLPADTHDPQKDIGLDFMPYIQESYDGVKNVAAFKKPQAPVKEEGLQNVSY